MTCVIEIYVDGFVWYSFYVAFESDLFHWAIPKFAAKV